MMLGIFTLLFSGASYKEEFEGNYGKKSIRISKIVQLTKGTLHDLQFSNQGY